MVDMTNEGPHKTPDTDQGPVVQHTPGHYMLGQYQPNIISQQW